MNEETLRNMLKYAFIKGQIDQAFDLAVEKDGDLYVGVLGIPYRDFVVKHQYELLYLRKENNMNDCKMAMCTGCPDCDMPINGGVDLYD